MTVFVVMTVFVRVIMCTFTSKPGRREMQVHDSLSSYITQERFQDPFFVRFSRSNDGISLGFNRLGFWNVRGYGMSA
jgi:hypothetical protein